MDRRRANRAWGECARSGQKMLLRDMVEDGDYPGTFVHPLWYEDKHPQESLVDIGEDPLLDEQSTPNNQENSTVRWPLFDEATLTMIQVANASFNIGDVTVVIS